MDFESLVCGSVFRLDNDRDDIYYMKMEEACDYTGGVVANAVNLSNGGIKEFAITQSVILVGAELLINE